MRNMQCNMHVCCNPDTKQHILKWPNKYDTTLSKLRIARDKAGEHAVFGQLVFQMEHLQIYSATLAVASCQHARYEADPKNHS